jgi:hypothetical protein
MSGTNTLAYYENSRLLLELFMFLIMLNHSQLLNNIFSTKSAVKIKKNGHDSATFDSREKISTNLESPITFFIIIIYCSFLISFWRHDTQHKDIQHIDTQHKGLISDIQHNDT